MDVLLLQLRQEFGFLSLHATLVLRPEVIGRLSNRDHPADVREGLALGDELLSELELADDLFGCVTNSIDG